MGIYNPLYNEETGWTPMDQLQPWQQTLMNPSAGGAGYNTSPMQMDLFGQIANQGSTLANPGGSNNFIGMPSQQATNPFLSQPSANTLYGNGNVTGTSGQTPVIGSPSLANNMGMQGAQNVGGVGMYTGANAPLNMSLFAPQGQDAAIMQGSMGGLGEMLYKAAQQGGLNPNTSYLGFIDDLSRRALAAKGGQGGLLPQDFVNYMNSQAGQQWFQGMRTPASQPPGTPIGSPVVQQTGPQNPPVAPLPSQNQPQFDPTGQNQQVIDPQQTQQILQTLAQQGYSPQQAYAFIQQMSMPTAPGSQVSMRGYPGMDSGRGYNPNYGGSQGQTPVIGSPGMMGGPNPQSNNSAYDRLLQQGYSPQQADQFLTQMLGDSYTNSGQVLNSNRQQAQPDWNSLTDYGRQQMGMPTEAQWRQMQGNQQSPPQYGQQVDYRAATYGTQPQTPAPAGGSGNIPNTTNPLNPLTSQQQYAAPGWGSATNRRSGFGNTSLFGTPYGSGGSTGFGGTNPSQYRGAGIYGRPASYGQSQRPY